MRIPRHLSTTYSALAIAATGDEFGIDRAFVAQLIGFTADSPRKISHHFLDYPCSKMVSASIRRFFARNRVTISILLFLTLIVENLLFETKPRHGWFYDGSWQGYCGLLLVLLGVCVRSWAAGILRKGADLTTVGPYSLCRNPLYLGSFSVMFGFCMLIGHGFDFLVVCGPIAAIYIATVLNEEQRLDAKYSSRWREYAQRTPRFIPSRIFAFTPGDWSLEQWLKSREYQALISTVLGSIVLEAWRLR